LKPCRLQCDTVNILDCQRQIRSSCHERQPSQGKAAGESAIDLRRIEYRSIVEPHPERSTLLLGVYESHASNTFDWYWLHAALNFHLDLGSN